MGSMRKKNRTMANRASLYAWSFREALRPPWTPDNPFISQSCIWHRSREEMEVTDLLGRKGAIRSLLRTVNVWLTWDVQMMGRKKGESGRSRETFNSGLNAQNKGYTRIQPVAELAKVLPYMWCHILSLPVNLSWICARTLIDWLIHSFLFAGLRTCVAQASLEFLLKSWILLLWS